MSAQRLSFGGRLFLLVFAISLLAACTGGTTQEVTTSSCPYRLPWSNAMEQIKVSQGYEEPGNQSHYAKTGMAYAIDFALPEGTPVLASREGMVSKIHDGETVYGDGTFRNNANFVIIDHGEETYSLYLHLQAGIPVTEGQRVQRGQVIGYSGKTGWTNGRPHLHFQLQERGDRFGQSIPLCFEEVDGGVPLLNQTYTSQNQMVMAQGIQVTREPEQVTQEPETAGGFPWDPELLGLWEGEVEDFVDGNRQTPRTLTVEITKDCPTGDICLLFPGSPEPGPYPHDQPGDYLFCFGDGYNYYCFGVNHPSTDILIYDGHGPGWVGTGELHRVSAEGNACQSPNLEPLDMTDPNSIFLWVKYSLEQKDLSMLGQLLPDTLCLSSASVGCRYIPEIPRETALEDLQAHLQGNLTCIGYRVSEGTGGFRSLSVITAGWNPGWETGSDLRERDRLVFSFSNSWSATPSQLAGLQVASSDELRLDVVALGAAADEICP